MVRLRHLHLLSLARVIMLSTVYLEALSWNCITQTPTRKPNNCLMGRTTAPSSFALYRRPDSDGQESSMQAFERSNPLSDKIAVDSFHHVEFYCGDATSTYKRFILGLGMELIAKSDCSTGNDAFASYTLQSGRSMRMMFTAPYNVNSSTTASKQLTTDIDGGVEYSLPLPGFDPQQAMTFFTAHGLAVRAVAVTVDAVHEAFNTLVYHGAIPVLPPTKVEDEDGRGSADIAEVKLYGDVVLRLVNVQSFTGSFLPNFHDIRSTNSISSKALSSSINSGVSKGLEGGMGLGGRGQGSCGRFGIDRFDHIVGNVWNLQDTLKRITHMTGFHEFAEFTAEDVGTVDSGLNSVVLANNNEMVLLPINEPTFGTRRKSQIQTYLEQNKGEGVQHIALLSTDIFDTMRRMKAVGEMGGFEFMPAQPHSYYESARKRCGTDLLTEEQYQQAEELGILVDRDDQGVLLQIFTKPIGDRPTIFFEVIQRVGCVAEGSDGEPKAGCGGFGKGNFKDLFKSIEDFENSLNINAVHRLP